MFPVESEAEIRSGGTAKRFWAFNVQQREPFLMDWGEMNFDWKGRKEVYILRRREMVKTRFPSGALDSEIQQVCRTSLFWVEIRALTLQVWWRMSCDSQGLGTWNL
jgi:hypothetical protein